MESTVTETITHESTPTGTVETRETTVDRDEGDITESWLSAQFASVTDAILQRLSVLESQHQTMLENLSSLLNRMPENLTNLLQSQQSTITTLVTDQTEMVKSLLIPRQPEPVVIPTPEESVEVTLEPVAVAVPAERPRPKRRIV